MLRSVEKLEKPETKKSSQTLCLRTRAEEPENCYKMKILILLALTAPILAIQKSPNQSEVDESQWKVGDCILANFTLDIQVHLNKTQPNATTVVHIPQDAKVLPRSHCGTKDNPDLQVLALGWTVQPKNDTTKTLYREISISFKRNTTLG